MAKFQDKYVKKGFYLLVLATIACNRAPEGYLNLRPYFYPIYELKEGKFYEYESLENPGVYEFLFVQTIRKDSESYLGIQTYDPALNVVQFSTEKVVSNGTRYTQVKVYGDDMPDTGQEMEIIFGAAYPFYVVDSMEIFVTNMRIPYGDSTFYQIIRNKRYKRFAEFEYQGERYDAVELHIDQVVEDHADGVLSVRTFEKQIFAEGIGLVQYTKYFTDNNRSSYVLRNVYTPNAFHEKYKDSLD